MDVFISKMIGYYFLWYVRRLREILYRIKAFRDDAIFALAIIYVILLGF